MSHELRTPLTSVLGFAKLAMQRFDARIVPHVVDDSPRTRTAIEKVKQNLEIIVSEGERLTALINEVLDSGDWWFGERVAAFEQEFAAFQDAKHCISCTSGTTAIEIALRALGIGPGDEVIVEIENVGTLRNTIQPE